MDINTDIQIFNSPQFGDIRTAGTPDNPLFCLADLCRVLEIGNPSDTKKRLKPDGVGLIEAIDSMGRKQSVTFINEQNLYRVIMRSDKPQAEAFQDWVCGDVLPAIRKTGKYAVAQDGQPGQQPPQVLPSRAVVATGPLFDVRASLEWMQGLKDMLGLGHAAMVQMVQQEGKRLGMPVPTVMPRTDSREALAVSKIIKKWGLTGLKAAEFNQKMLDAGAMTVRNGRKVLTGWGLDYGENRHSERTPNVVWAVYYEDCFPYLCDRIGVMLSFRDGMLAF